MVKAVAVDVPSADDFQTSLKLKRETKDKTSADTLTGFLLQLLTSSSPSSELQLHQPSSRGRQQSGELVVSAHSRTPVPRQPVSLGEDAPVCLLLDWVTASSCAHRPGDGFRGCGLDLTSRFLSWRLVWSPTSGINKPKSLWRLRGGSDACSSHQLSSTVPLVVRSCRCSCLNSAAGLSSVRTQSDASRTGPAHTA